jgi:hypothetical protein
MNPNTPVNLEAELLVIGYGNSLRRADLFLPRGHKPGRTKPLVMW